MVGPHIVIGFIHTGSLTDKPCPCLSVAGDPCYMSCSLPVPPIGDSRGGEQTLFISEETLG